MNAPANESAPMACPDLTEEMLAAVFAGTLSERQADRIAAHLKQCPACRRRFDTIRAAQPASRQPAPPVDPADDDRLESFNARLQIPPPVFEDLQCGDSIGPYQVLARLGLGGSSTVYDCLDPRMDRRVAVKVLTHPSFDQQRMARLEREARLLAKLDHASIVRGIEIQPNDFPPYIVMELVPGGPSSRLLTHGPLAARDAARLVANVAHALDHAHRKGILHRDIKPSNLLIASPFEPGKTPPDQISLKISDFDLARSMRDDSRLTRSDNILGTPAYMSPEQAQGRHREVGPASDIYSLGAVLYEFLVGRPPLVADNPIHTMVLVMGAEPVSPRAIQPGIRRDLDTICMKCLRKNPAERYATAQELAEDLERFLEGRPILARPLGRLNRLYRWCRRNRALASAIGGIFLLLASLAGISTYAAISQKNLREVAENNARLYEKAAQQARHEEDFSRNMFISSFRNLENYVRDLEKIKALGEITPVALKARSFNRQVLEQYILRVRQNIDFEGEDFGSLFRDGFAFRELGYTREAEEIWFALIEQVRKLPANRPDHPKALRAAIQTITMMAMDLRGKGKQSEAADLLKKFLDDFQLDMARIDLPHEDLIYRKVLLANLIDSLKFAGRGAESIAFEPVYRHLDRTILIIEGVIPPDSPPASPTH